MDGFERERSWVPSRSEYLLILNLGGVDANDEDASPSAVKREERGGKVAAEEGEENDGGVDGAGEVIFRGFSRKLKLRSVTIESGSLFVRLFLMKFLVCLPPFQDAALLWKDAVKGYGL